MADFEVRFLDAAVEDVSDSTDPERIVDKAEELEKSPSKRGKPLKGELAGLYSLRAGDHRIIYEIDFAEAKVWIYGVGLRKEGDRDDIYERAKRWFAE